MQILIGTKNEYKVGEMQSFLDDISGIEIHLLKDIDLNIDIDEDQDTLKGNAEKKAIEMSKYTDMYVLTSDGGNDIPGLGDKWDVLKNQRIVGEENTDLEKANKLLSLMQGLKGEDRRVVHHFALAIAYKGELLWSHEEVTDSGYILESLEDEEIPPYRWIGHLWYYPMPGRVQTKLNEEELRVVREKAKGMMESLRSVIGKIREDL